MLTQKTEKDKSLHTHCLKNKLRPLSYGNTQNEMFYTALRSPRSSLLKSFSLKVFADGQIIQTVFQATQFEDPRSGVDCKQVVGTNFGLRELTSSAASGGSASAGPEAGAARSTTTTHQGTVIIVLQFV